MLSKVAQVLYPIGILPLRTDNNGWLSNLLNQIVRASFTERQSLQWRTSTGKQNNEFKRHERYRYRF